MMKKRFFSLLCFALVTILFSSVFVTSLANESTGIKGDLNNDGVLNKSDHTLLTLYLQNGSGNFELSLVDFNADGVANEADKTAMMAAIVSNFDNNGDGKLSATDYRLLEKYLSNYDVSKLGNFSVSKCDLNGDGVVSLKDLRLLGNDYQIFDKYSPRY